MEREKTKASRTALTYSKSGPLGSFCKFGWRAVAGSGGGVIGAMAGVMSIGILDPVEHRSLVLEQRFGDSSRHRRPRKLTRWICCTHFASDRPTMQKACGMMLYVRDGIRLIIAIFKFRSLLSKRSQEVYIQSLLRSK